MKTSAKIVVLLMLALGGAAGASAQGTFFAGEAKRLTPAGIFGAGGASVKICTVPASGIPCTPSASVFADQALAVAVSNPLPKCTASPQTGCIDNLGNFTFFAPAGLYAYTVSGAGLTGYGPMNAVLPCFPGVANCGGGGGGGGYNLIQSNGSSLTSRTTVDFISGAGISNTCVDNPGASRTDCTVSNLGVTSLNSLVGAVTLAAGTNVTLTPAGNTITISSSAGGGGASITVNAGAPLGSPANFQNQTGGSGLQTLFSNPSGTNVQVALTGTATKAQQYALTAYQDANNSFQPGTLQDFNLALMRVPIGTGIPSNTSTGIVYFRTDLGSQGELQLCNDLGCGVSSGVDTLLWTNPLPLANIGCPFFSSVGSAAVVSLNCGRTNAQSGTSYTVAVPGDNQSLITSNNASPVTVTAPGLSTANRFWYDLFNVGAGTVTQSPAAGGVTGSAIIPQNWFARNFPPSIFGAGITSAVMPTLQAFPDCQDANGNHLNFTLASGKFACGSSGVTPGKPINMADPKYGLHYDVEFCFATSASVTVSGTTVTCSTADFCNNSSVACAAGKTTSVGKTIEATNGCCGGAAMYLGTRAALSTIATVNSATSVTMAATATGSCSGNCIVMWGTNDDAAVTLAENDWATGNICNSIQWPVGAFFVKKGHFNNPGTTCTGAITAFDYTATIRGYGPGSSLMVPTSDFDWTTCPFFHGFRSCFFAFDSPEIEDLGIYGASDGLPNVTNTPATTTFIVAPSFASQYFALALIGFAGSLSNTVGMGISNSRLTYVACDGFGIVCGQTFSQGSYGLWTFWGDTLGPNLKIVPGTQWFDYAGEYGVSADSNGTVRNQAEWFCYGCAIYWQPGNTLTGFKNEAVTAVTHAEGMRAVVPGINGGTCTNCIGFWNASGTLIASNSVFNAPGRFGILNDTAGIFQDIGYNQISGTGNGFSNSVGGLVFGDASITGSPCVSGNLVLSAGWGATRSISSISGGTRQCLFTVSATGGSEAASPTITVTFPNSFFVTPSGGCSLQQVAGSTGEVSNPAASALTNTGVTWTFSGTPVDTHTYTFIERCSNP